MKNLTLLIDTLWGVLFADRNNYLNGNLSSGVFNTLADQHQTQDKVDMLDIPGKGRCYVYIARCIFTVYYICVLSIGCKQRFLVLI